MVLKAVALGGRYCSEHVVPGADVTDTDAVPPVATVRAATKFGVAATLAGRPALGHDADPLAPAGCGWQGWACVGGAAGCWSAAAGGGDGCAPVSVAAPVSPGCA